MKSSFVLLVGGVVLVVGTLVYLNHRRLLLAPAPVAMSSVSKTISRPENIVVPKQEPLPAGSQNISGPVRVSVAVPAPANTKSESRLDAVPIPTSLNRAIETLVSSQASLREKQVAWKQFRDAGQLDQAIETLKQDAAKNPASAEYPAELGQAQLQKAGVIAQSGGKISEMGILGMQADQNFDAALKLDPFNWEAQFYKAAAMAHWPLELNKGQEVIQRFSNLIDQRETIPPQPQFAQTYVLLGDQYQKMGQPDYAVATWQLGATKFPNNSDLQKRISDR